MKKAKINILYNIIYYILVVLISVFFLFPVYWMVASSLKTEVQMFSSKPLWIFFPTLKSYIEVFKNAEIMRGLINSLLVSIGAVVFTLTIATLAAYSFERFKTKGSNVLKMGLIISRMLPPIATVLPIFLIFKRIAIIDSRIELILALAVFNLPLAIWIMQGFISSIPKELEESALVDGCTRLQTLVRVIIPLIMPGTIVTAIFVFFRAWNDFLFALILTERKSQTMPVVMAGFIQQSGEIQWGQMFATATIVIFPTVIFGLLIRKHFISGITMGSVKE